MAKRGYKLQEFVAHSANVNCLRIGKKACRLLITGGDDQKVNLWAIGKPSSLMSLCGHTSPVESLAFDSAEVLVLGGASAGVIKLWDLEEAKMVRTLSGHRSSCTAVEFHPFGEFFASGSMDTNLKIWDIRKKGCIHTYKGHTRGVSTIRFTPDGRWVVSGGIDNVVKVWDLTAGKLLHDFNFHEGHIRSIDFHPLEFLLATGSADRTVKFWDLETFELIGSTRPEATGVRATTFHPDGRTLFCGFDDGLKVYSWEPVICHDAVDMGWSTLGDLCVNDGKLLGCSSYQNAVGVWVADVSHIEPYGAAIVPEQNDCTEVICNPLESHSLKNVGNGLRSTSGLRCESPDYDTKDIKTIYVDSAGENNFASQKVGSLNLPKVEVPSDSKEISDLKTDVQSPPVGMQVKSNGQALEKSFIVPSIIPRESSAGKDSFNPGRESITFSRTKPGMLLRPAHVRKPSHNKIDAERLSTAVESGSLSTVKSEVGGAMDLNCQTQTSLPDDNRKSCEEKGSSIKNVTEKLEKILSPQRPSKQENSNESLNCNKGTSPVKIVNGVAVVEGRIRSLVERFERREGINSNEDQAANDITPDEKCTVIEDQAININPHTKFNSNEDQGINFTSHMRSNSVGEQATSVTPDMRSICSPDHATHATRNVSPKSTADQVIDVTTDVKCYRNEDQVSSVNPHMRFTTTSDQTTDTTPPVRYKKNEDRATTVTPHMRFTSSANQATDTIPPVRYKKNEDRAMTITPPTRFTSCVDQANDTTPPARHKKNEDRVTTITHRTRFTNTADQANDSPLPVRYSKNGVRAATVSAHLKFSTTVDRATNTNRQIKYKKIEDRETTITPQMRTISTSDQATNATPHVIEKNNEDLPTTITPQVICEAEERPDVLKGEPQISGRDTNSANDAEVIEFLMQTHDVFSSTLRSRLTKLQVVRHFWGKNDTKGAIGALRKLPDYSVQADVISVLMEKLEILTLDDFACLLPMLVGLLDSKMERHVNISLEMLLKLVAVFGPVVNSTVSAPPAVGVDLHAEKRRECCKQCFIHLQKLQKTLPALARRGGSLARGAQELNLVLQQS